SVIAAARFTRAPRLASVNASGVDNEVIAVFDKPVDQTTAETIGNYSIAGQTITSAALMPRPGALAGHWKLDDLNAVDTTGNTPNGTVAGVTLDVIHAPVNFDLTPGTNKSLTFNGTSSVVTIPDSPANNMGFDSFTVAAWVFPTNTSASRR